MLIKKELVIKNKQGLHARPAAIFVQVANKYRSKITVIKGNERVSGKSIMGLMSLAAEKGSLIQLSIDGTDAEDAMQELELIIS